MEKKGIAEKYRATSYKSLKRKISSLSDILDNAYGKSYCQISNPTLIGNVVNLGIDNANKRKSRDVTHSFGMKLRALMLGKEVEITFCDVQRTKKKYKFTDEERLSFVLFGILYVLVLNGQKLVQGMQVHKQLMLKIMSEGIAAHHLLCLFVQLVIDKNQWLIKIERK